MKITKRQLRMLIREAINEQASDKQVKTAQDNLKTMFDAVDVNKIKDLLAVGGEAMEGAFLDQFRQALDKLANE